MREGRCAVLLHGFGADRLGWAFNSKALEPLADVAVPDLPGHGNAIDAFRGGDRETLLAQVEETVAGHAGTRRVTLFGHSLGGGLALGYAERYPERVDGLFLIAPVGLGRGISRGFLRGFSVLSDSPQAREAFGKLVSDPERITDMMVARSLEQLNRPGARDALLAISGRLLDEEEAYRASAAAVARSGLRRMVVWGEGDRINRFDRENVESFGGETHVIPGAGHLPHMEKAAVVTGLMTRFLQGATPSSG